MQKKRCNLDVFRCISRTFNNQKANLGKAKSILIVFILFFITSTLIFASNGSLNQENSSNESLLHQSWAPSEGFVSILPDSDPLVPSENSTNEDLLHQGEAAGSNESLNILPEVDPVIPPQTNLTENETSLIEILPENSTSLFETTLNFITDKINAIIGEIISLQAILTYDNDTPISGRVVDFYTDEYIGSDITDEEGKAEIEWDTSQLLPAFYSLSAKFSGDTTLNSSLMEVYAELKAPTVSNSTENLTYLSVFTDKLGYNHNEIVDIFGEVVIEGNKMDADLILSVKNNQSEVFSANFKAINGTYIYPLIANFENSGTYSVEVSGLELLGETTFLLNKEDLPPQNLTNKTNSTKNLTEPLTTQTFLLNDNVTCQDFEENILWSSSFSNNETGSTFYQTWNLEHNCDEAEGPNCFLKNVSIKTRSLDFFRLYHETDVAGEGYFQISNPDESICDNPQNGIYSRYLAYESSTEFDGKKLDWGCGKNVNNGTQCGVEIPNSFNDQAKCYGIKGYGSQNFVIDAFKVHYTLCWEEKN